MLVWELSLKGFLGQDSTVFDDFGDPPGAFEDVLEASRVDFGAHFGSL